MTIELNDNDYNKAINLIKHRQEYNKSYYKQRKEKQKEETPEDNKPKKKQGRKPITSIDMDYAAKALEKYKLKCKRKALNTEEEIRQEINKLIFKLKEQMNNKK